LIAHYDTLTDLWHLSTQKMLFATREELDFVASIDTMVYNNVLTCDSMNFNFDLGRDLWLNKQRFTVLQRDYLDLYELNLFLDRCKQIGLGAAKRGVVTQMFAKQHARGAKKYRWGNCMIGWSFRGGDKYTQPTLTLHSRVSYIAYIGGADLALCYVLAREIGRKIGKKPSDFAFEWHVDSLQFHGFKSIPYLFRFGLDEQLRSDTAEYPSNDYPTLKLVRKWWSKMAQAHEDGVPLDKERYGPLRRIRRRYGEYLIDPEHTNGVSPPRVPLKQLTFDKLRERG
jgi:hypothetical protein